MSKHIIIVHGYLLSGSGSNIYSCNLAMQWKKQGHAITVFCQDQKAGSYDWVDEFFTSKDDWPQHPPSRGQVRVVVPDIAGLLPVYNYNEYDGYTVKTIPNCSDEEIERHIEMTSREIKRAVTMWGCDQVLANHALLSPVNTMRALEGTNIPFNIKIHGSALSFVIKPFPRYKKYALEAMAKCNKIIAGTRHVVKQVLDIFKEELDCDLKGDLDLKRKLVIVPPGMDPTVFLPLRDGNKNQESFRREVENHVADKGDGRRADKINFPAISGPSSEAHSKLVKLGTTYDQRVVDADLLSRLPTFSPDEPVIMYVGHFLHTKGVAEILLSFPAIVKRLPKARLLLVGYGTFREHLMLMIHAMTTGNINLFKAAAHSPDERGKPFLDSSIDIDKYFRQLEPSEVSRITVTGYLNHTELGFILPLASVLVVASKWSEAFGMVAVEAMSAGVLPLCVYHSGLVDVLDRVKETDPELEALMHMEIKNGGDFELGSGASFMEVFTSRVLEVLQHLFPAIGGKDIRALTSERLREVAVSTWSWDGICKRLLEL